MPTVEINHSQLYYEVAGDGPGGNSPVVILGHAGFLDSRMWDAQWTALADRYRVVRYDLQGYGQSSPATGPISRREEVLALVRHLGLREAIFVGSSLSGTTYLDLALARPDLVRALVVANGTPSGFQMAGEPPRYMMDMIGAWQQGDFARASELQLRIWLDGSTREPEDVDPVLRQRAAAMNLIPVRQGTGPIADFQPIDLLDPPAVTCLGEVRCPTLVIDSTLEHPEVRRAAQEMAEAIPNARRVTIEGAAHVPNFEQPAAFNRALLDFLATLD